MFNKRDAAPIIFLFLCAAVLFSPVLFTGKTYFLRDITYLFHPWKSFAAEAVQKGELPLWNPYTYCGMPFLANWQSAVFYPFSILFYLFPFASALKAYGFIHVFLAGFFAYLFGRKTGLSRGASAGMMLLFAFNGYLVTRLEFLGHAGADAWTFALLLLAGSPVMLSAAAALSFLAGHQIFFVQAAVLLLFLLLFTPQAKDRSVLKGAVFALLLFAGLVSCQLLPTIELSALSARLKAGLEAEIAMLNSLRPADLARMVSPLFPSSVPPIAGERLPWPTTFHVGAIGFLLALAGIAFRPRDARVRLFALALTVSGLLLALGDSTPVYPWLYAHLPFFRILRYPSQFLLLAVTGLTLLAGSGLDRLGFRRALVPLIALELVALAYGFQLTAPDSFFSVRPAAAVLMEDDAASGRFILSPGTEKDRRIREKDTVAAWQKARGYLYGAVCLPYHLRNAYGSGEPLTLRAIEDIVDQGYAQQNAQASLPFFERMGVRHLVSKAPLPDEKGYVPLARGPVDLYRLENPSGLLTFPAGAPVGEVTLSDDAPGRVRLTIAAGAPLRLGWKEARYPGWKLYVNRSRVPYAAGEGPFMEWEVPAGHSEVIQLYRPFSFAAGALLTLLSLSILAFYGIMKLCAE